MFYECTLLKALQMIGVDVAFDFDVAVPNPPWMDANEDGILSVHSKRSRTPVQPDDRDWIRERKAVAIARAAPLIESTMRTLRRRCALGS